MMDKAPDAYRTISEVGEDLDIAQHVLRFWETRFPQIKPLKRGGGRRYYRPDDVDLLKGIRHLLYREGYTIKGVQRILREQGPKGVIGVGRTGTLSALGGEAMVIAAAEAVPIAQPAPASVAPPVRQVPAQPEVTPLPDGPVMAPVATTTPQQHRAEKSPPTSLFDIEPDSIPTVPVSSAGASAQVSFLRGGIHRGDGGAVPAAAEGTASIDRRARLRLALAELEVCQSILRAYRKQSA